MSNLNFSGVTADNAPKTIKPGVHENVMITGVTDGKTSNGKSIISIGFQTPDNATFTSDCSMEGKAPEYTMRKIKHLLSKFIPEETINNITSTDQVNKQLTGKTLRIKFQGEEYLNKEGQVRIKTALGLPNFAESMKIAKVDSSLTFDSTNNYDIKRLSPSDVPTAQATTSAVAASDDLPF
jgi:hypothetical protein